MAWDMLGNLNANPAICVQPAWRENYPTLLEKHRKRLFEPIAQQKNLTDAMIKVAERPANFYHYASGSTHEDKRQQLMLGEETNRVVHKKLLGNE